MSAQSYSNPLILASTSPYRKSLLQRLGLDFDVENPVVEESRQDGESPAEMAARLAAAKAAAVAAHHPQAVVIGSDQVAVRGTHVLGKPGVRQAAERQLLDCSGKVVLFLTAVCIDCRDREIRLARTVTTEVQFRDLNDDEVRRYVERDEPLQCAGGFKAEAAGITLFRWIRSDDPTALIGLPLIAVSDMLRECGYPVP